MSEFEKWLEEYDDGEPLFTAGLEAAWSAALSAAAKACRDVPPDNAVCLTWKTRRAWDRSKEQCALVIERMRNDR